MWLCESAIGSFQYFLTLQKLNHESTSGENDQRIIHHGNDWVCRKSSQGGFLLLELSASYVSLSHLFRCPFCNFPALLDKDMSLFSCPNPRCRKVSPNLCLFSSLNTLRFWESHTATPPLVILFIFSVGKCFGSHSVYASLDVISCQSSTIMYKWEIEAGFDFRRRHHE